MNELDEIMSGDGNAVSEAPVIQQEQPATQPRDDSGRFASQQVEQPAVTEQPVTEQATQEAPHESGGIPQARLRAEAGKRREAEATSEALRREIAELRGMVTATRQPAPQPQQEKQPVSIFENPEEFLQSQLSPVQQQLQEMREEVWESRAASAPGSSPELVAEAKAAAEKLFGTPEGKALHQQLTAKGGNPFVALVEWHKQQQTFAKVGNDPDAWLNAEIEKRMQDPAFLASAMERARASAAATPSNRSQPLVSLPPSLNRLPAGGNLPADNDTSDGALFSHATR